MEQLNPLEEACGWCGKPVLPDPESPTRRRSYCDNRCRQKAYRRRAWLKRNGYSGDSPEIPRRGRPRSTLAPEMLRSIKAYDLGEGRDERGLRDVANHQYGAAILSDLAESERPDAVAAVKWLWDREKIMAGERNRHRVLIGEIGMWPDEIADVTGWQEWVVLQAYYRHRDENENDGQIVALLRTMRRIAFKDPAMFLVIVSPEDGAA